MDAKEEHTMTNINMPYFHIYFDKLTKGYEIYQSRRLEINTYSADKQEYYFAVFMRLTDASNYVKWENKKLSNTPKF